MLLELLWCLVRCAFHLFSTVAAPGMAAWGHHTLCMIILSCPFFSILLTLSSLFNPHICLITAFSASL
jgi:hypothetical protein